MTKDVIADSETHEMPADLRKALSSSPKALAAWNNITPLARNEWICWTISVKAADTRKNHVDRAVSELAEGKRRPCCWIGCIHRKDKKMSPSQKFIIGKRTKRGQLQS